MGSVSHLRVACKILKFVKLRQVAELSLAGFQDTHKGAANHNSFLKHHLQINEVERNGFIYYPAFCRVVMRKLREDDEENFRQELFRTLVGAKPYSDGIPAKLYNINTEYLTFEQVGASLKPKFSSNEMKAFKLQASFETT